MKTIIYAFILGVLFSISVFLTNVVFPNNGPDNETLVGFAYLVLFILFGLGGYINSKKAKNKLKSGAIGGAITAFIVLAMIMITFVIVDNVFLNIVSKQADKVTGFNNTKNQFYSMRDYINYGLLMGSIIVLPLGTVIGGVLGIFGSSIRAKAK